MSDLVRSEVEAALEYANNLLGTHLRRDRIQPALAAARAWLSTPTEPTDEQVEAAAIAMVKVGTRRADPEVVWESGFTEPTRRIYREKARAALVAAGRVAEETP